MSLKKDEICTLLEGEGESFGGWLSDLLYAPNLTEAIVVSPYLTLGVASQIVLCICQRPKTKSKPRVTLVVGALQRFTRKPALQHLLKYASGGRRENESNVRLSVVRPPDGSQMHLKAAWFDLGTKKQVAAVGSHNLTEKGLTCEGELGIVLHRTRDARLVEQSLRAWLSNSKPWLESINSYEHSKSDPEGSLGAGRRPTRTSVLETGPSIEACEGMNEEEEEERDAVVRAFETRNPKPGDYELFWNTGRPFGSARKEFPQGAHFDFTEDADGWREGKPRMIVRVFRVLPTFKGKESLVLFKVVLKYKATARLRKAAERLGISEDVAPEPSRMQCYLDMLQAERLKKNVRKTRP